MPLGPIHGVAALAALGSVGLDDPLLREPSVERFLRLLRDEPALVAARLNATAAGPSSASDAEPSLLQLPDPPLPGGIVPAKTSFNLGCACADGFEAAPSLTLPLHVPSVQALNARCAATKVHIRGAPNPARAVSFVPPPNALTARQVGDELLRLPFTRGEASGTGGATGAAGISAGGGSEGANGDGDESSEGANVFTADAQGIPWAKATRHHLSDVEGRTAARVMGVPGGDVAEFFFALQAAERLGKEAFTSDQVLQLLRSYVTRSPRLSFYHATDSDALERIAAALGLSTIDLRSPPVSVQPALLEFLAMPTYTGAHPAPLVAHEHRNASTTLRALIRRGRGAAQARASFACSSSAALTITA